MVSTPGGIIDNIPMDVFMFFTMRKASAIKSLSPFCSYRM